MRKIKCDDEVVVIAGKDKGKHGKVIKVLDNNCLIVSGVQMVKKTRKPNPQTGQDGGFVERESAIQISNVAIFNKSTEKADKVGFKKLEDGKKIRVFKSNGEAVDAS